MNEVEKNMAVSALAQLLDQQPTAYAEVLAACRAMGWNASPTAQPADIIAELPSNVLPFIRRMLALLIYGDGSADSPAVVPATDRLYAQMLARQASPNYPAAGFPSDHPFLPQVPSDRNFAHLPQALSALSARKISGADVADGTSVVRLVSSIAAEVKALTDTNTGWTMTSNPLSLFPNTETFQAYCKAIAFSVELNQTMFSNSHVKNLDMALVETITQTGGYQAYHAIFSLSALENVNLRKLKSYNGCLFRGGKCSEELWLDELTNAGTCIAQGVSGLKRLYAPKVTTCNGYSYHPNLIANNPDLEYAYIPELANYTVYGADDGAGSLQDMPKLEHLVIGRAPFITSSTPVRYALDNCPKLILLDIRGGLNVNLYLDHWSPTLDSSNLDQFLQNFRSHIALRLTDNGSGKTLTLSQAVYDAIKDETHLFVFDEGTMTIYAYLTNIKHWTVTK